MQLDQSQQERFDAQYQVPGMVSRFVVYFYNHIRERNVNEIHSMYTQTWAKLSDRYFKSEPWPAVEFISKLVDNDYVFNLLYKEMYYRHLYARTTPTMAQRIESWNAYQELFSVFIHGNVNILLPNQWLWDMVDEFCYQFQAFAQYKGQVARRSPQELAVLLDEQPKAWSADAVLHTLRELVHHSKIREELSKDKGQGMYTSDGLPEGSKSNVLRVLGYFSLTGLCRVHCLLGDYEAALKNLDPIRLFSSRALFSTKLVGCHITMLYYAGFSYLMLRRYMDAIKCFNHVLVYILQVKGQLTQQDAVRSALTDQVLKRNEQLYALVAMTVALCPQVQRWLDESVLGMLREKYEEKMISMGKGEEAVYDEMFSFAAPKFVSGGGGGGVGGGGGDGGANPNLEVAKSQLALFLEDVRRHKNIPALKQYLLLYTSIPLSKLAGFMSMEVDAVREQLEGLRAMHTVLCHPGGDEVGNLEGARQSVADIEFRLEKDSKGEEMICIEGSNMAHKRVVDTLAKHVNRFHDIQRDLNAMTA